MFLWLLFVKCSESRRRFYACCEYMLQDISADLMGWVKRRIHQLCSPCPACAAALTAVLNRYTGDMTFKCDRWALPWGCVDPGAGHADVDASQRTCQVSTANSLAEWRCCRGCPYTGFPAASAVRGTCHDCLGKQAASPWRPHEGALRPTTNSSVSGTNCLSQ